jgi:hypothetical protein
VTRAELDTLVKLNRQRGRLVKQEIIAAAAQRKTQFEEQLATEYHFDSDETWKTAVKSATIAVEEASRQIDRRCKELGIPKRFRPYLGSVSWYDRGENGVKARRAELVRVFEAKNAEMEKAAKLEVDRAVLRIETELLTTAIESDEARRFLESMPAPEQLLRTITVAEAEKALPRGRFDDDDAPDIRF